MQMKLNTYCNECLTRAKQHCEGRCDATDYAADTIHSIQVMRADGSYEVMADYIQTGASSNNRLHGLNFCPNYQLNIAMLPRMKSAQVIRDEFNAQRAANKAATKTVKDAAKAVKDAANAVKLKEKKQKAKLKATGLKAAERKQETTEHKAAALKQEIVEGQRVAERATQAVMQSETISQAVTQAMEIDEDFGDLII